MLLCDFLKLIEMRAVPTKFWWKSFSILRSSLLQAHRVRQRCLEHLSQAAQPLGKCSPLNMQPLADALSG
jgi:hypothetical protein